MRRSALQALGGADPDGAADAVPGRGEARGCGII